VEAHHYGCFYCVPNSPILATLIIDYMVLFGVLFGMKKGPKNMALSSVILWFFIE
jgi:hypothetical protein